MSLKFNVPNNKGQKLYETKHNLVKSEHISFRFESSLFLLFIQ